jgi:hypothetical protein
MLALLVDARLVSIDGEDVKPVPPFAMVSGLPRVSAPVMLVAAPISRPLVGAVVSMPMPAPPLSMSSRYTAFGTLTVVVAVTPVVSVTVHRTS